MQTPTEDDAAYDPPVLTHLGSLAELTEGPATGVEDGLAGQGGDTGSGGL